MRIIKAAKKVHEAEIICCKCHSILGVVSGDIRFDGNKKVHSIQCPVCQEFVGVPSPDKLFPWIMEDEENENEDKTTYGPKTL